MALRYGLEWDRNYLVDIAFRLNTVCPVISSLILYPANFFILFVGLPGMKFEIRAAYVVNVIAHVIFDWTFAVFVRVYQFAPYGLLYCEGLFSKLGLDKHIIMGALAFTTTMNITVFFILMMQLHQLTVLDASSRWKLSGPLQIVIYVLLTAFMLTNVFLFIVLGEDVENYEDLIKNPDLAWLIERGGTLLLFGKPGSASRFKMELYFLGVSFAIFFPFLMLYAAHALIYLSRRNKQIYSTKTQLLIKRLFDTFITQLIGAHFFFIIPLFIVLITSVYDLSGILPSPLLASLRFITTVLLALDPAQFSLAFFLRSPTHRQMALRGLRKICGLDRTVKWTNATETRKSIG